jgi:hypothetical protein
MDAREMTEVMDTYPDLVADALAAWKKAGIEKDRIFARAYLELKARSVGLGKVTVSELESNVRALDEHYKAALDEVIAESEYVRVYEKLMSAKKQASMRSGI